MQFLSHLTKENSKQLLSTQEDYKRLEYALKLNLRLINGVTRDMRIYVMNQTSASM